MTTDLTNCDVSLELITDTRSTQSPLGKTKKFDLPVINLKNEAAKVTNNIIYKGEYDKFSTTGIYNLQYNASRFKNIVFDTIDSGFTEMQGVTGSYTSLLVDPARWTGSFYKEAQIEIDLYDQYGLNEQYYNILVLKYDSSYLSNPPIEMYYTDVQGSVQNGSFRIDTLYYTDTDIKWQYYIYVSVSALGMVGYIDSSNAELPASVEITSVLSYYIIDDFGNKPYKAYQTTAIEVNQMTNESFIGDTTMTEWNEEYQCFHFDTSNISWYHYGIGETFVGMEIKIRSDISDDRFTKVYADFSGGYFVGISPLVFVDVSEPYIQIPGPAHNTSGATSSEYEYIPDNIGFEGTNTLDGTPINYYAKWIDSGSASTPWIVIDPTGQYFDLKFGLIVDTKSYAVTTDFIIDFKLITNYGTYYHSTTPTIRYAYLATRNLGLPSDSFTGTLTDTVTGYSTYLAPYSEWVNDVNLDMDISQNRTGQNRVIRVPVLFETADEESLDYVTVIQDKII